MPISNPDLIKRLQSRAQTPKASGATPLQSQATMADFARARAGNVQQDNGGGFNIGRFIADKLKSLPELRTGRQTLDAVKGVGKGFLQNTVVGLAKTPFGGPLSGLYNLAKSSDRGLKTNITGAIDRGLEAKNAQQKTGKSIGRLMGSILGYEVGSGIAGSALGAHPIASGILGGTAAGQLDVEPGENRLKRAATDAATLAAFAGAGKLIGKLGKKGVAKAVEQGSYVTDVNKIGKGIKTALGINPKDLAKAKTVYRGTLGTGEIDNILSGKAKYSGMGLRDPQGIEVGKKISEGSADLWSTSRTEAQKYARDGLGFFTGDSGKKIVGQGNWVLEGKLLPDGRVIPTRAVDAFNPKKAIDLLGTPKAAAAVATDPVQKITNVLNTAAPAKRAEQEAIYSKVRGSKLQQGLQLENKLGGEAGFQAKLGAMKGEMKKVDFQSIRDQIQQKDVDHLFTMVKDTNKITDWEKLSAQKGLAKVLGAEGGQVPTNGEIELLNKVFPADFMSAVLDKRSTMTKLWGNTANALSLPRAVMATADLSAPLRQGLFLAPSHPKEFGRAFKDMFKYAFSEKSYQKGLASIESRPTYHLMREAKLALTDTSPVLTQHEEAFASNLVNKIPGFGKLAKGSERAYSGFLNQLRADVFDSMVKNAQKLGRDVSPSSKILADIGKFVNAGTGRGNLGELASKAAPILNGAFFSPRLMASRLQLMNPVTYIKMDPFVRKEALKSLFAFAAAGATVAGIAKAAGAEVSTDPRSADFGKIKIGNTRFDPYGGFQQYAVLAYRLASGEMVSSSTGKEVNLAEGGFGKATRASIIGRFLRSKEAPVASFATDLLTGQTANGAKVDLPVEIADRFIPMVAQDTFDLYREAGPQAIPMAAPAIFGVGVQTYSDKIPMNSKTATGKPKIDFREQPSLGETLLNQITGKQVSDIPKEKWAKLYADKQKQDTQDASVANAKARVLRTGKSERVGNTVVYLDNGIVKTKKSK